MTTTHSPHGQKRSHDDMSTVPSSASTLLDPSTARLTTSTIQDAITESNLKMNDPKTEPLHNVERTPIRMDSNLKTTDSKNEALHNEERKRTRTNRHPLNPDTEYIYEPWERAMRKGPVHTLCQMYMRQVDPTIRVQHKAQAILSIAIEEEEADQMKRHARLAAASRHTTVKRMDVDLQHRMVYEAANGLAFFPVDRPKRPERRRTVR